jgi:hypothetical protein
MVDNKGDVIIKIVEENVKKPKAQNDSHTIDIKFRIIVKDIVKY